MEDITLIKEFLKPFFTDSLMNELKEKVKWYENLISVNTGEIVSINRKMAYVSFIKGDYMYANLKFPGVTFDEYPILTICLNDVNKEMGVEFNSVLLNLYNNGKDKINWHSDREEIIGPNPIIACVNLGAKRKFWFRKKEFGSEKFFYEVEDGDLLIMGENCQKNYLHAILPEKEVKEKRISLTFRKTLI